MTDTTYTIQMASKISGVGVHTIRAWEKRYKALVPERDSSGHRTYTKSDVEKLMLLSELCLLGYTISKVAMMSTPELKEQLKNLGKSEESLTNQDFNLIQDTKPTLDPNQSLPILSFALKTYNLDVINVELTKLKSILSGHDFALKVLMPLYQSLKDVVKSGAMLPHQESACLSLLKFHMGFALYHPAEKKEKGSVNAVIAGVEGDYNDFLLGLSGLLCGHYGFHYTFLGANTAVETIADVMKSFEANLLILGPLSNLANVGQIQNAVERLNMKLAENINIVVAYDGDVQKIQSRRLNYVKNLDAVDSYLDNYLSRN